MTSDGLRASWERTERHLRAALAGLELAGELRAQVVEFIEHNELGVAFEWLVYALAERATRLDDEVRERLGAAAVEMGLEENSDWLRLTGRGPPA